MGISLEQYRSAIGLYQSTKSCTASHKSKSDERPDEGSTYPFTRNEAVVAKGPWKLHAVLLFCLYVSIALPALGSSMLPPSRLKVELQIGGIEQNPGPITTKETVEQKAERLKKQQEMCEEYNRIIAELITKAPNEQVKQCLKLYNPEYNTKRQERSFESALKDVLVETLAFLGFPGKEEYDKKTVAQEMVCAIQNYLPDTCRICKDSYRIKLGETPLLKCCKCGQGVHNECFKNHLGLPDGTDGDTLTHETVMKTIDPTKLQGLHYFCGGCEKLYIPSPEDGKLKRLPIEETPAEQTGTNGEVQNEEESDEPADSPPTDDTNKTVTQCTCTRSTCTQKTPNAVVDDVPVCKFYRQNKCRHKNPKDCNFRHPRPCKKLVQHGTNEQRGCTLGKDCSDYHPIMCRDSLTKGVCLNELCRRTHIKGTKRTPKLACKQSITEGICLNKDCKLSHAPGILRSEPVQKHVSFQNENQTQNSFLEELRSLKIEMLTEVEKMISLRLGYPQMQMQTPNSYADMLKQGNQTKLPGYMLVQANQTTSPGNQLLKLVEAH
jgi:hypothetical protein